MHEYSWERWKDGNCIVESEEEMETNSQDKIEKLERDIKEEKKKVRIENLKIWASRAVIMAPFVLVVGGEAFIYSKIGAIPFERNTKKLYSAVETKFDSLGNESINDVYVEKDNSTLTYYSGWVKDSNYTYSRIKKSYDIDGAEVIDIKKNINNNSLDEVYSYSIEKEKVPKIDTNKPENLEHYEACIYNIDENKYEILKESMGGCILHTIGSLGVSGITLFIGGCLAEDITHCSKLKLEAEKNRIKKMKKRKLKN